MVTRKYVKDYRLDDFLDRRGNIRSKAVYIGGDYVFAAPEQAGPSRKRTILFLHAACWLFGVGALLPASHAARTMYCVLPLAASLLPLAYESSAVYILLAAAAPFRHDQADKLSSRLPASALAAMILSATAFAGFCVSAALAWDALSWGDAVFAALCGALTAASAAIWRLARHFRTKKADSQPGVL